jgi:hypothetical protein
MKDKITVAWVHMHLNADEKIEKFSLEEAGIIYDFLRKLAVIEVEMIKEEGKNDSTERTHIRTGKH